MATRPAKVSAPAPAAAAPPPRALRLATAVLAVQAHGVDRGGHVVIGGFSWVGVEGDDRRTAAVLAVEAVGMCVAAGFSAVSTADGQSYQRASGIALTLIAVGTAVVFALFARGLAKASPWTRTPVVMTQLAIGVWAIYLLRDHRLEWGLPMLLVAACCLAALFTPASLRALNRPSPPAR